VNVASEVLILSPKKSQIKWG